MAEENMAEENMAEENMAVENKAEENMAVENKAEENVAVEKRIVKLKSSDEKIFEVEEDVARKSEFVSNLIDDAGIDHPLPLYCVSSNVLSKVLEYCKYHVETDENLSEDQIMAWDAEFMNVELITLYDLILAANYMHIQSILDLAALKVAEMIKGKTPQQIRETFHIQNDFTPEEEAELRRENDWAFDGVE